MRRDLLRLATAGSVDDGKSTLIGRLLYETKSVLRDQLEAVERASARQGLAEANLALLVDGLRAEREQGITIDVAYRYLSTPRRSFILADTPGHPQYTRNMVTGASTAELVVVLVDARQGLTEQSRRHAAIASLLRVPHVVLAVNKMDLVGYEREPFEAVREAFSNYASRLDFQDVTFIPLSALKGDNVTARSSAMPWYEGTTLLHHLEEVHVASDVNLVDLRLPIQRVIRPRDDAHHDYRAYVGRLASGVVRVGDELTLLPGGSLVRVTGLDAPSGPVQEAFAPMVVAVRLDAPVDVSRGDLLARPKNLPHVSQDLDAMLCWLDDRPLELDRRYLVKHTTASTLARPVELAYRLDLDGLHRDRAAPTLGRNELGRLRLRAARPICFDAYQRNRSTGSFILIDEASNATAAAGMLLPPRPSSGPELSAWEARFAGNGPS